MPRPSGISRFSKAMASRCARCRPIERGPVGLDRVLEADPSQIGDKLILAIRHRPICGMDGGALQARIAKEDW